MLKRPYNYVSQRLHWRGLPASWNDIRLSRLKNRHLGQRCVIIGMGPSLSIADLDKLHKVKTFACNKIYLSFPDTRWRPDYYTVIDVLVAENNQQEISQISCGEHIHPMSLRDKLPRFKRATYYSYHCGLSYGKGSKHGFRESLFSGMYGGGFSVIIDQLQLAYYMGFAEAYLIGVDFSFQVSKSTGTQCESGEVLESEGEVNHFHKDYRKPGETWTQPRLDLQEKAFEYACEAFERDGRKLMNASRETKLSVIPKVDFDACF